MDLLQLEHFLAVVEEGTFTRAAARVSRTQPAVSQSIKKLEEELGTPLFARDLQDVALTDAGSALAEYARRMVQTRNDAIREVGALKNSTAGTLNIAAHESAAVYLLPAAFRFYLQRFRDIRLNIHRSRLQDIPRQVLDREVHVGFVKDVPTIKELQCVDVHSDELILVAAADHPLTSRPSPSIRDLGEEQFVVHQLCNSTEQIILRLFEQHRTRCRIVAEVGCFENIKDFVEAGVGLAIVPQIIVRRELLLGTLTRIRIPELQVSRRTLMIYREHESLSRAAHELIALVRNFNWNADDAKRTPQ